MRKDCIMIELPTSVPPLESRPYDLILKGGHVIDPKRGLSTRMDVAIANGRISAVEKDIYPLHARRIIDVSPYYVTPGLIDMHVHLDHHFYEGGLVADAHSFSQGVTTFIDAGSPGALSWDEFHQNMIQRSRTRILAFLNIVDDGMRGDCEQETFRMRPELAAEAALAHSDLIVGIKCAHYWTWQPYDADHGPWTNIDRGVQAGELCHMPVMVDFWPRPERPYADLILQKMRPGDIHTHVFGQHFPILDDDGRLNPILFEARQRGIIFDLGHGAGSFWFRNAIPALAQGFVPDSLGTDLHKSSIHGLPGGQLGVMSKYLCMGMSLEEAVRRATVTPAQQISRPELGTLDIGAEADVAVLALREGEFAFVDCGKAKMVGHQMLQAALTLRAGQVVYDSAGLTYPDWHSAPPEYWICKQPTGAPAKKG
jgi:dihydroorotase